MARILVNYIYNKEKDEFKILGNDCVFADQGIAVLETEEIINKPLVVPIRGAMTVVDKDKYEQYNRKFYLVANEKGEVKEEPNGTPVYLAKDTDISKLKVVNGQLVLVQDEEPKEDKKEKIQIKKN